VERQQTTMEVEMATCAVKLKTMCT